MIELEAANARIAKLELALNRIASWREGDVVTGSFDEPEAAKIAREALKQDAKPFAMATRETTGEWI